MKENYFLYRFLDIRGNVLYVGKTINLQNRLYQHFYCTEGKAFKNELKEFITKIEFVSLNRKEDMDKKEKYYVSFWKPPMNIDLINGKKEDMENEGDIWIDLEKAKFEEKPISKSKKRIQEKINGNKIWCEKILSKVYDISLKNKKEWKKGIVFSIAEVIYMLKFIDQKFITVDDDYGLCRKYKHIPYHSQFYDREYKIFETAGNEELAEIKDKNVSYNLKEKEKITKIIENKFGFKKKENSFWSYFEEKIIEKKKSGLF